MINLKKIREVTINDLMQSETLKTKLVCKKKKYCMKQNTSLTTIIIIALLFSSIAKAQIYYVSPTGNDTNPGTITQPWATLQKAASTLTAGETAYFRNGTYVAYVVFTNDGSSGNPITFQSYPGEYAVFDGSNVPSDPFNPWNVDDMFSLYANYIILRNFEVKNAASQSIYCGQDTHDNLIDSLHIHNCYLCGVYLSHCSYHTVANCKIHDTYDYDPGGIGGGGNSDGIGASAGNIVPYPNRGHHIIRNNVVYNCSDDGIDMWSSNGNLIENNVSHHNGYGNPCNGGSDSSAWGQPAGNGMGFKLGGGGSNKAINNISYSNRESGFDGNGGSANIFYNNTSFNNQIGFSQLQSNYTVINNLSNSDAIHSLGIAASSLTNSWDLGILNPLFISIDSSNIDFLKLSSTSPALNVGTDLTILGVVDDIIGTSRPQGLGYDIGAYEYNSALSVPYNASEIFFSVYPNPAFNSLTIKLTSYFIIPTKLTITNTLGQKLFSTTLNQTQTVINISDLPSGLYLIAIGIGELKSSMKIVKQ